MSDRLRETPLWRICHGACRAFWQNLRYWTGQTYLRADLFLQVRCDSIINMKNRKIKGLIIKTAVPLVILAVLIIIKVNMTENRQFRISRYVLVSTDGFDGRGKAEMTLDEVGIYTALADGDDTDSAEDRYKDFVESLTYSLDKKDNLSNGDVITLTVEYDEELARKLDIKVEGASREIEVSGLESGTLLDAFEDVKIITGGISPYIYAAYANESDNEYLASLEYEIDRTSGLSIGEEIIITCKADEEAAASQGYYFDTLEMRYTIEEADKYVDNPDEVDKDVILELAESNIQVIRNEVEDTTKHMSYEVTGDINYLFRDSNETAEGFEFRKAVLAYNDSGFEQKHENYILLFYKGNIVMPTYSSDNPNQYLECWFCFMYSDAVIRKDGEWSMATNDPEERYVCGTGYEDTLAAVQSELNSSYTYTDITIE